MDESEKSSTWRELAAIKFLIEAFGTWHTDSQNAVRIIQVSSMVSFRLFRRYVCLFINLFIAIRFFVSPFCLFFFKMFLALESGPPLVAVGILFFRDWRTNYRQQSCFPRRLERSILTGGCLLDRRSLLLPKRRLTPFLRRRNM